MTVEMASEPSLAIQSRLHSDRSASPEKLPGAIIVARADASCGKFHLDFSNQR